MFEHLYRNAEPEAEPAPKRGSGAQRKKLRRAAMWREQGGLCWWCKQPTRLPPDGGWPRHRQPNDGATIEHLLCKADPRRLLPANGERRQVMACAKCNHERGRLIDAITGPLIRVARAKPRLPKGWRSKVGR